MNYYDELGIGQESTAQEIHRAYRGQARLLHPDNFQDDERRRLAELQMQHLNQILHTLTHPEERLRYDIALRPLAFEELAAGPWERPSITKLRAAASHWFGILSVSVFVAAGIWYWTSGRSQPIVSATAGQVPPPAPLPRQRKTPLPEASHLGQPLAKMAGVAGQVADVKLYTPAPKSSPHAEWTDPPPIVSPQHLPDPHPPAALPTAAPAPSLSGLWLFVPQKSAPDAAHLYAPEYIELLILESNGKIIGKYTARYRIPDRPISPEVNFRLEGNAPAAGKTFNLGWSSADGTEGEAALKHLTPSTLDFKWWTTRQSHSGALSSGESVLVRQQSR